MFKLVFPVFSRKLPLYVHLNGVTLLPRFFTAFSRRTVKSAYWEFDRGSHEHSLSNASGGNSLIFENRTELVSLCKDNQNRTFSTVSFFAAISASAPVQQAESILECIHSTTGFAWWSTILITTLMLRLLLLPLVIYQNHIIARYENLMPEVEALAEELKKETSLAVKLYKWDEKTAKLMYRRSFRKHTTALIVRDNCHPFKSVLVVLFQLPAWISFSFALRDMSNAVPYWKPGPDITFLEMTVGGILWFPNLALPDQYFIMPVLLGITNLLITEIHTLRKLQKETKLQKAITNFFRFLSIIIIPIAMMMPTCITLYWLQSSMCGLAQNLLLRMPRVRRFFGIPKTPSESQTPFLDIMQNFKLKFKIKQQ